MATTKLADIGKAAVAEKGWFDAYKWLIIRRLSQVAIMGIFLLGPVAGFHLLKGNLANSEALEFIPLLDPIIFLQMLAGGIAGITVTAVMGVLLVVVTYALIGGRAFCSWVCPLNIVTDAARWLRRKLELKGNARIKQEARYWMLAAVLLVAFFTGTLAYELVNPVSVLHRGIIFGMGAGWTIVLGVFLFDLFVVPDGWCGHLCPMGALYGLIGNMSLVRVRADARELCDDCMECYEVCPEKHVIPPALKEEKGNGPVILSPDCTNCGRCIDICSVNVYRFGLRFPNVVLDTQQHVPEAKEVGKAKAA